MKKNYEPYKKIFRQIIDLLIICVMTLWFYFLWHSKLNNLMSMSFQGKGNLLIIFSYIIFISIFMQLWGGFKLGYNKILNVVLSQFLAVLSANFLAYIQVVLMIGTINYVVTTAYIMLGLTIIEMVSCLLISIVGIKFYVKLFPAHQVLQINGDYVNHLSQKIKGRDDKYQICEEVSIHEPWDVIKLKMEKYDTVLLNDIPSSCKNKILKYCFGQSIRVYFTPKISDIIVKGTEVVNLFDSPLLLSRNIGLNFEQRLIKRTADILVSFCGLVLLSPVMLVTALCIKCDDGGPVFYKQERCTEGGKIFTIYKFRSMIVDAEKDGKSRPASEYDSRITRVGKFIRKTRIDEIPQLVNILKGEMSLIGPRPERIEHVEKYCKKIPEFKFRMKVKGGLTGYAQVYGRYNTSAYDKLKMDLLYIVNYSVLLDLQILFETVKILFKKESTEGFSENQISVIRDQKDEDGDENNLDVEP